MTKNERAALVPELKAKIAAFTDEMLGAEFSAHLDDPNRNYPAPARDAECGYAPRHPRRTFIARR